MGNGNNIFLRDRCLPAKRSRTLYARTHTNYTQRRCTDFFIFYSITIALNPELSNRFGCFILSRNNKIKRSADSY
jgi:hypothetical protein